MMKTLVLLFCAIGLVQAFVQGRGFGAQSAAGPAVKSREIVVKSGQTFLNLPVNPANPPVRMTITAEGKAITAFNIRLSESPTFWTYFDVPDYQGRTLTVEIPVVEQGEIADAQAKALATIYADATFPDKEKAYTEKDRPQVHFSAIRGHLNDPNGLVYYRGEYHLFFQHNPYGVEFGNQHWGHAVGKDLLHWTQIREAIYPTMGLGRNDLAFSGSATYDPQNTSGFRKNGVDPLIVFYTSTGRGESIKLSYDNGRTFVDYEGNPVISHNGRDPKILWYAPGRHWVLVVWDAGRPRKLSNGEEVSVREHSIYTSTDMKRWTYRSGVSGFFECPDLYELPVQGQPGVSKWVMSDANGRYMVGSFDGKTFTPEQQMRDYVYGGRYYYAAQTFNNMPDNRRVQIAWGNYQYPGMPFNQAMLFPNELKLRKTEDGFRLTPTPVKEIATLYKSSQVIENKVVTPADGAMITVNPDAPLHVIAVMEKGDAPLSINIAGYRFGFDNEWVFSATPPPPAQATVAMPVGRGVPGSPTTPPSAAQVRYTSSAPTMKFEAILDKNILEVYVDDGQLYFVTVFAGQNTGRIDASIAAAGNRGGGRGPGPAAGAGSAAGTPRKFVVKRLEVHELNSIWPKQ